MIALKIALLCALSTYVYALRKLPSYITPCAIGPNFDECATKNAREAITHLFPGGDPDYNVPVLDPLDIKDLHANGRGSVSLSFILKQAKLYGLKDMKVKHMKVNFDENKISLNGNVPLLQFKGDYKINGQILLLPLKGEGNAHINISNVDFAFTALFDKESFEDGTTLQKLHSPNLVFKQKSAGFLFHPFKENRVLGSNLNQFFNDNQDLIIDDIGPSFGKGLGVIILDTFSKLLTDVPFDEIYLPN